MNPHIISTKQLSNGFLIGNMKSKGIIFLEKDLQNLVVIFGESTFFVLCFNGN